MVYLRRQDDFIESLYTQSIHLGASHSFEEFLKPFDGTSFNWQFLVDAYAQIFGRENIIIRRYHKKFLPEANSLIQDFGSVISSDFLQNFTKTSSRNRGLTRDALEITRYTNPHLDDEARYQLRNIFQEVNSKQPFEKYAFFTPGQRSEFLSMYGESNAAVAREYLHETSGKLFPAPVDGEHKSYAGLSQEAFAVNLSKAILAVNQRMLNQKQELRNECRNMFLRNRIKKKVRTALNRAPGVKKNLRKLKFLFA